MHSQDISNSKMSASIEQISYLTFFVKLKIQAREINSLVSRCIESVRHDCLVSLRYSHESMSVQLCGLDELIYKLARAVYVQPEENDPGDHLIESKACLGQLYALREKMTLFLNDVRVKITNALTELNIAL